MVVERGGCTFVTKVRNIAHAGAKAAIIIDSKSENITNIQMSDDGTGAGLRIPSVLIGKESGDKLIQYFKDANTETKRRVNININFMKPHPQAIVDFDFWFTSSDFRSLMFMQNIRDLILPIIDQINFRPRQVLWSCPHCAPDFITKNCYSGGKYCAMSHDLAMEWGGTIVMEDLEITCIWDMAK